MKNYETSEHESYNNLVSNEEARAGGLREDMHLLVIILVIIILSEST